MTSRRGLLLLGAVVLLVAGLWAFGRGGEAPAPVVTVERVVPVDARATADRVLAALKAKDGPALAALVHPDGVRMSPSAFVDIDADQRLSPAEITVFWHDPKPRLWGHAEGSGDPIELAPAGYAERYIVDHDYAGVAVGVNGATARGTTVDNAASVYPGATRIEYFRQGAEPMDWSALRLVLAPVGNDWRLVGIIHDAWAP